MGALVTIGVFNQLPDTQDHAKHPIKLQPGKTEDEINYWKKAALQLPCLMSSLPIPSHDSRARQARTSTERASDRI